MVLRSRGRHASIAGVDPDVGLDRVALQTSVFGAVLTACSSNPQVSLLAPPAILVLIAFVGVYGAAAAALVGSVLVIHFATPPNPITMAAGVLAGAVVTPRLAACVVVWAVTATAGTMALIYAGLNPWLAATIAAVVSTLPAAPFYRWRPVKEDDHEPACAVLLPIRKQVVECCNDSSLYL